MRSVLVLLVLLLMGPGLGAGQSATPRTDEHPAAGLNREQAAPGSAGPRDGGVVQRGAQPNAAEVRPGNRDGDSPSAAAGTIAREPVRRLFGLPVTTVLVIGGVIIALAVLGGLVIPRTRNSDRARGGGTYGGSRRR